MSEPKYMYDAAFSYAAEDREYVERVASAIGSQLRMFYDRYERVDLWGRDLYTHLADVYGRRSRFCVLFLSQHYARNVWTSREREAAQARALYENSPSVLPARFDDTVIPGVSPSISYIDLREMTPEQFAALLVEKVRRSSAPSAPRRWPWRWLTGAAAATVATGICIGWGAQSHETTFADAGTPAREVTARSTYGSRSSGGQPDIVVHAEGAGSTVVLDGGVRIKRQGGSGGREEASAAHGGTVVIGGDISYEDSAGK